MAGSKKNEAQPSIQSLGGLARREALSAEERKEIASRAAKSRWAQKPIRATHKGNFKDEFGIDVDCYVLDDEKKTGVISKRGMGAALGMGEGGSVFPYFIRRDRMAPYVGSELAEKLSNPLIFQWAVPGANTPVHGYDVTILIDVCKAIIAAEDAGVLGKRQQHIVKQAHVILNASAKAGIQGLVYALAGYDATREEVVAAFKFFVREEAREYEREFPAPLYEQWYRLYRLPKPEKNRPWKFKNLTIDHVYTPLARSNGKILELTRARRASSGDRHKKLHQFLSEVGVKALRTHLGQLLGIAQVSADQAEYEHHVKKIFDVQLSFDL